MNINSNVNKVISKSAFVCEECGEKMERYACEIKVFDEGKHQYERIVFKCPKCGRRKVERKVWLIK